MISSGRTYRRGVPSTPPYRVVSIRRWLIRRGGRHTRWWGPRARGVCRVPAVLPSHGRAVQTTVPRPRNRPAFPIVSLLSHHRKSSAPWNLHPRPATLRRMDGIARQENCHLSVRFARPRGSSSKIRRYDYAHPIATLPVGRQGGRRAVWKNQFHEFPRFVIPDL